MPAAVIVLSTYNDLTDKTPEPGLNANVLEPDVPTIKLPDPDWPTDVRTGPLNTAKGKEEIQKFVLDFRDRRITIKEFLQGPEVLRQQQMSEEEMLLEFLAQFQ